MRIKVRYLLRTLHIALAALLLGSTAWLHGQTGPKLDLAVTFVGQRSLKANSGENFWSQGGAIELGIDAWRGWGIAADVTGTTTNSIGSSGVPLSLVSATFGPRYRWHAGHHVSVYGQGLLGEANGFRSVFPSTSGADTSTNSLAVQVGGGLDLKLSRHIAMRVLDAGWLRTQLPNGTNGQQNSLRLGAGLVIRSGGSSR